MGLQNVLEQEDALFGVSDLNGAITVENLTGLWNATPGDEFTNLQTFDTINAWDEENGASLFLENGLNVLETDGTQANSRVALETAALGIYRSGTQVRTAGGMITASDPQGDQFYEWGYGRDGGGSHVRFRDTADDLQIRIANETSGEKTVSRDAGHFNEDSRTKLDANGNEVEDGSEVVNVYGLDRMDGQGPSGINYRRDHGYVMGFLIGWYGPTVTVPFLVGVGDIAGEYRERVFPICILDPVAEPLFTRPNEPWTFLADNNGTAPGTGGGLRVETGGRQFSYGGNIAAGREQVEHQSPQIPIPMDGTGSTVELKESGGNTREWYVVGVFKRKAADEETALSLGNVSFTSDRNFFVHSRVIPEADITGSLEYSEPTDTHADSTYVEVDMWAGTSSRLTVDTATIDGRTRLKGKSWGGRLIAGSGKNNKFTVGQGGPFRLQFVRQNPVVLLASTPSGDSATVAGNIGLPGVQ